LSAQGRSLAATPHRLPVFAEPRTNTATKRPKASRRAPEAFGFVELESVRCDSGITRTLAANQKCRKDGALMVVIRFGGVLIPDIPFSKA